MTTIRSFPLSLAPALGCFLLCACNGSDDGGSGGDSTGGAGTSTGSDATMSSEPTTTATTTEAETATTTTGDGETDGASGTESDSETDGAVPMACVDLKARTVGILDTNCTKCHGPGSPGEGGINYILDLDELTIQDKVIPGDPEQSRIYVRMVAAEAPMPPLTETQRPTELDIEIVRKWITDCAGVQSCSDSQPISTEEVLGTVAQDLEAVGADARKFTRYLSLVHLANAGYCDAEIEVHRQALSKLVNSLSQAPKVVAPVAIDAAKLLYRIDIRDYAWEGEVALSAPTFYFSDDDDSSLNDAEKLEMAKLFADKWDMIADQSPYSVRGLGAQAELIADQTATKLPILQGDAFIDVASRAPLYYDILGIPMRSGRLHGGAAACVGDGCLETQLGLDILNSIEEEFLNNDDVVGRAGFHKSDISEFNRVVERHLLSNDDQRSMWVTYDFASQTGLANVFKHPLDFEFDLNAILFALPNGLHGYMLADDDGNRLDEAPVNILQDPSQKDFINRSAVSCMGCHSQGLIKVQDDVRWELDTNMSEENFDAVTRDKIRDLYPQRENFILLQEEDIQSYSQALAMTGVVVNDKEPVITSFLAFDEDVNLRRAAAEFGLTETELIVVYEKISQDLPELGEGGTIQRVDFTGHFAASICALGLGLTRCCPVAPELLDPSCG